MERQKKRHRVRCGAVRCGRVDELDRIGTAIVRFVVETWPQTREGGRTRLAVVIKGVNKSY